MIAPSSPSKTRSPNYPSISLDEAIQRLKPIYEKQQRYPASREVLAKLMGYKGLNGASATVVSALSKYRLLEGHGDNLRVSELGQDLVLHRKGDPEYTDALRTAAFMPAFFQELRDQYPTGLPHDHSLRASLTKRGFNPKAIDGAVRAYRDTIEFLEAEIGEMATDSALEQSLTDVQQPDDRPNSEVANPTTPLGQHSVSLPLSSSPLDWATLTAAFPLSEAAWNQMIAVLTAMKPALVVPVSPQKSAPLIADVGDEQKGAEAAS